eukprot:jgi/Bigna1/145808/aug1.104_g20516
MLDLVASRALRGPRGLRLLVPILDIANHAPEETGGGYFEVDMEEQEVRLRVGGRGAAEGEEVFLDYGGGKSSDDFLMFHGFVPDRCPSDSLVLDISSEQEAGGGGGSDNDDRLRPQLPGEVGDEAECTEKRRQLERTVASCEKNSRRVIVSWTSLAQRGHRLTLPPSGHPDPSVRRECEKLLSSFPSTLRQDSAALMMMMAAESMNSRCNEEGGEGRNDDNDDVCRRLSSRQKRARQREITALEYRVAKKALLLAAAGSSSPSIEGESAFEQC